MQEFLDHNDKERPKELDDKTIVIVVVRTGNKDENANHLLGFSGPIPARLHDWNNANHPNDTDSGKPVGAIVAWRLAEKDSTGQWESIDVKKRWSEKAN